jgi:NAD(P)-dependent dehydrogenase (short-subunit alcohol dehydrogenase family)
MSVLERQKVLVIGGSYSIGFAAARTAAAQGAAAMPKEGREWGFSFSPR